MVQTIDSYWVNGEEERKIIYLQEEIDKRSIWNPNVVQTIDSICANCHYCIIPNWKANRTEVLCSKSPRNNTLDYTWQDSVSWKVVIVTEEWRVIIPWSSEDYFNPCVDVRWWIWDLTPCKNFTPVKNDFKKLVSNFLRRLAKKLTV